MSEPLVFISHKHSDEKIASKVREFITARTAGAVTVYQSSTYFAEHPQAGRSLTSQLRKAVSDSGLVILVYTSPDNDWNYCMWEVGIASDPETPEAKIIVLHFGQSPPKFFTDQVTVKVTDEIEVQKFLDDLLTKPGYYPGRESALTKLVSGSNDVAVAARSLIDSIQPEIPKDIEFDRSTVAWPMMVLTMDYSKESELEAFSRDEVVNTLTVFDDHGAGVQVFGMASSKGKPLRELINALQDRLESVTLKAESNTAIDNIVYQIKHLIKGRLAASSGNFLTSYDNRRRFLAVACQGHRRPWLHKWDFEIYFFPEVADGNPI